MTIHLKLNNQTAECPSSHNRSVGIFFSAKIRSSVQMGH
nr:MAG TPA: hypothetical protein [Caudoviricetes sp.]